MAKRVLQASAGSSSRARVNAKQSRGSVLSRIAHKTSTLLCSAGTAFAYGIKVTARIKSAQTEWKGAGTTTLAAAF